MPYTSTLLQIVVVFAALGTLRALPAQTANPSNHDAAAANRVDRETVLSNGRAISLRAKTQTQRISVLSPHRVGSMTLGYSRSEAIWKSWLGGGPFDVTEPLYFSVTVVGRPAARGVLHVVIAGLNCYSHCETQSRSARIRALPRRGRKRMMFRTKTWGCGEPQITAWVSTSTGRSTTEVWRPATACGE